MKHYGDITKISGYEVPIVDVITGGSPCQDLSVAGKRAGLDGERSGLFMEQIRVIKEMRERDKASGKSDEYVRPRYMVWENVPGALSSPGRKDGEDHRGEDFQAVLTEIVRVVKPDAPNVPLPAKGGWRKSGCLMGYGENGCPFSIAYRVHDAQFWGVAQRRKRIALVADFGGFSAPEVCFERKGMSGNPDQSVKAREKAAGAAGDGAEKASRAIGFNRERVGAVTADELMPTIQAAAGESGNNQPMVLTLDDDRPKSYTLKIRGGVDVDSSGRKAGKGALVQTELSGTLGVSQDQTLITEINEPTYALEGNGSRDSHKGDGYRESDTMYTLNTVEQHAVAYGIGSYDSNGMKSPNPHAGIYEAETSRTLDLNGGSPACNQGGIAIVQDAKTMVLNDQGGSVMCPMVYDGSRRHDYEPFDDVCETVQAQYGTGGNNTPIVVEPTMIEMTSTKNTIVEDGISPTLTARMGTGGNQVNALCMDAGWLQAEEEKTGALLARQYKDPPITYQEKTGALKASGYNKLGTQEAANDMYITGSVVRRLTPLECERLQGFPDGWTDIGEWVDSKGKKHKPADAPRYKALGNSIALPFWQFLARRICAVYERDITMASLFDGIGGFPYVFEHCGAKAVWASEIEEFPIAVTKKRFGED